MCGTSFVGTERGPRYCGIWVEGEPVDLAYEETRPQELTGRPDGMGKGVSNGG